MESLPDELLFITFGFLRGRLYGAEGQSDLCALSLASRRLSNIARSLLWQHVYLSADKGLEDLYRIMGLFHRSCVQAPECLHQLKSIELGAPYDGNLPPKGWTATSSRQRHRELFTQLRHSRTLEHLVFQLYPGDAVEDMLVPFHMETDSFASLKVLEVKGDSFRQTDAMWLDSVTPFLHLPNLASLSYMLPLGGLSYDLGSDYVFDARDISESVQKLHFEELVHFDALRILLPRLRNLAHLTINLSKSLPFEDESDLRDFMEPFLAVSQQLKTLKISAWDFPLVEIPDEAYNLSILTNLRKLHIPAQMLFGRATKPSRCPWYSELKHSLPPKLEKLLVSFEYGELGIFESRSVVHEAFAEAESLRDIVMPPGASNAASQELLWLSHLVRAKDHELPQLRSIKLEEGDARVPDVKSYDVIPWPGLDASTVAQKCKQRDIKLAIKLRIPTLYPPEDDESVGITDAAAEGEAQ